MPTIIGTIVAMTITGKDQIPDPSHKFKAISILSNNKAEKVSRQTFFNWFNIFRLIK